MKSTEQVSTKAITIIEQGKTIIINNADSYKAAGETWIAIRGIMKQVDESFDPIISKAHQAHKEAVAQKAKIYDPLKAVYILVKKLMSDWDSKQEALRLAEERRLREIARKAEEERILQEAIEAVANGYEGEAEIILEEPVWVPPIIIEKEVPKVSGGPVYRTIWKFRIKNADLIPKMYMQPDEVKIGGVVRAMKEATNIPGVEVYSERC